MCKKPNEMLKLVWLSICVCLVFALVITACGKREKIVTVYTSLDRSITEPIFEQFTKETGIRVVPEYATAITNAAGLPGAILAEKDNPRCDVFWNDTILSTILLKNEGLLQSSLPENAALYADEYKDPDGTWFGFAARARVLVANTNTVPIERYPQRVQDLGFRGLRAKTGLANPLVGTSSDHVACLFALLGDDAAKAYLQKLKANQITIQPNNRACVIKVSAGSLAAGLTDSDKAIIEQRNGAPITIVFSDKQPNAIGTLFIPNTIALIKDAPHRKSAQLLMNYLLSPAVEEQLANAETAQIPLNKTYQGPHPLGRLPDNRMPVDFTKAAAKFKDANDWIRNEFLP